VEVDWIKLERKVLNHFAKFAIVIALLIKISEPMSAWKAVGRNLTIEKTRGQLFSSAVTSLAGRCVTIVFRRIVQISRVARRSLRDSTSRLLLDDSSVANSKKSK